MEGKRTGGGSLRRKRKVAVFYCVHTFILFVSYFPSLSLVGTSVSLILSLLTIMTLCAVECISGSVILTNWKYTNWVQLLVEGGCWTKTEYALHPKSISANGYRTSELRILKLQSDKSIRSSTKSITSSPVQEHCTSTLTRIKHVMLSEVGLSGEGSFLFRWNFNRYCCSMAGCAKRTCGNCPVSAPLLQQLMYVLNMQQQQQQLEM